MSTCTAQVLILDLAISTKQHANLVLTEPRMDASAIHLERADHQDLPGCTCV